MWDWMATNSLFALLLGEAFDYATLNQGEIKRKSIGIGALTCAIIWLLCVFGETLIPPLKALRLYCNETAWIVGKIILGLLALPVGFPVAYFTARRQLLHKAEKTALECLNSETALPEHGAARKARQIQHWYEILVGVLLWWWYWFLSPVQSWLERGAQDQDLFAQTIWLLMIWLALAALLGIGGGKIVYRLAERYLGHRT